MTRIFRLSRALLAQDQVAGQLGVGWQHMQVLPVRSPRGLIPVLERDAKALRNLAVRLREEALEQHSSSASNAAWEAIKVADVALQAHQQTVDHCPGKDHLASTVLDLLSELNKVRHYRNKMDSLESGLTGTR